MIHADLDETIGLTKSETLAPCPQKHTRGRSHIFARSRYWNAIILMTLLAIIGTAIWALHRLHYIINVHFEFWGLWTQSLQAAANLGISARHIGIKFHAEICMLRQCCGIFMDPRRMPVYEVAQLCETDIPCPRVEPYFEPQADFMLREKLFYFASNVSEVSIRLFHVYRPLQVMREEIPAFMAWHNSSQVTLVDRTLFFMGMRDVATELELDRSNGTYLETMYHILSPIRSAYTMGVTAVGLEHTLEKAEEISRRIRTLRVMEYGARVTMQSCFDAIADMHESHSSFTNSTEVPGMFFDDRGPPVCGSIVQDIRGKVDYLGITARQTEVILRETLEHLNDFTKQLNATEVAMKVRNIGGQAEE